MDPLVSLLVSLGLSRSMVIGVARGGVALADRVARGLGAPLEVIPARKVVVGNGKGLAIGAVAAGGARIVAGGAVEELGLDDDEVDRRLAAAAEELEADLAVIQGNAPEADLAGRTVLLIDDGAITGLTMAAAAAAVRDRAVGELVAVLPYASEDAIAPITNAVHRLIAVERVPHGRAAALHVRRAEAPLSPEEIRDVVAHRLRDLGVEGTAAPTAHH